MDLDVEKFICHVQQRPAIWDVTCEDYTDKEKKAKAWEDLVNIFIDKKSPSEGDKKEFDCHLRRRWKSLRDCYTRELKIRRDVETGRGVRRRPVYVFFDQLSFLADVIAPKETYLRTEKRPQDMSLLRSFRKFAKRNKRDEQKPVTEVLGDVEKIVQYEEESSTTSTDLDNDCDRLFLLSLLNPLKRIPEHARFGVKRKLMDLLDDQLLEHYQRNQTVDANERFYEIETFSNASASVESHFSDTGTESFDENES